MQEDCLFCKIIRKEIPSNTLYEDEDIMAFLDVNPTSEGHTLVIPKTHYTDITEIPDEVLLKLFNVGKKLTPQLMGKLKKESMTYLINYGDAQAIKHIHLHLIPNCKEKNQVLNKDEVYKILKG